MSWTNSVAVTTNSTSATRDTITRMMSVNHTSIVNTTFNARTTEDVLKNMVTLHTSIVNWISLTNGSMMVNTTDSFLTNLTSVNQSTLVSLINGSMTVNTTDISLTNGSMMLNTTDTSLTKLTSPNQSSLVSQGNATWSTNNTEFTTAMPPADYLTGIMYLSFVMSAILVVLGLFGNITTALVMQKTSFRSKAHSLFLSTLALYDSICLISLCLTKGCILFLFGIDLASVNDVVCKVVQLVLSTARLGSIWVIVLICIERFMAAWLPLKAKILLTKRAAFVSVICVSAISIVLCGLSTPFAGVVKGYCLINSNMGSPAVIARYTSLVLNIFLPNIILLLLTPLTIGKLCHLRAKRLAIGNKTEDATARNAILLISVVTEYFLVSVFATVINVVLSNSEYYRTLSECQFRAAILECLMTIGQINYSLNFFLYGLTSSDYRHAFREMLLGNFR